MDGRGFDETGVGKWIPEDILEDYEMKNYNHAAEILADAFPEEFLELVEALRALRISTDDLL